MPTAEGNIYTRLSGIQPFHPFSAELLPEDWSIEPGDVVKIKSDDGEYNVPIYSTGINWTGASVVSLSTTGNQERKPLPELKRKEFEQSRATYGNSMAIKKAEEEIESHWKHVTQVTDQGMSDAFGVIGVKIGADGKPVKDSSGHYVWDDSGAGGEIWGHLNRTAWDTQIVHHIKDENGKIISLGEVYTDAYGNVIINAINDQRTGTATINANRIALNASGTITLNTRFGITDSGSLLIYGKTITDNDVFVGRNLTISEGYAINFSGSYDDTDYSPKMAIFGYNAVARQILAHEDLKVGLEAVTNGGQIEIKFANNSSMNKNSASFSINAISDVAEDENPPTGKIGFTYTKLDGTTGTVNFNIAATQYFLDTLAKVSFPTPPRTSANFEVAAPGPVDENNAVTTIRKYFYLDFPSADSWTTASNDVTVEMKHNENGSAVSDGIVAQKSLDISSTKYYIDGVADAYANGQTDGYNDGYADGLADGKNYVLNNIKLYVSRDNYATQTELINGQSVTLNQSEQCEIDLEYDGNYIRFGYVNDHDF